jgi:hypothetical protein
MGRESVMKIRGFLAMLVLAMVVVYFIFFAKTGGKSGIETEVQHFARTKIRLTEVNFETLAREIHLFAADKEGVPETLKPLQRMRPLGSGLLDGWGRDIRYEKLSETSFRLRSAGQDGVFETEDDVVKDY